MLTGGKNLKDGETGLDVPIKDSFLSISYTKTNKLITALYMVTDIIDKGEPIRNKLRYLGAEIISDIHSLPAEAGNKIAEIVSFLNIASAMNLISEMNSNILKKEFLELNQSIKESTQTKSTWLEEFLLHPQFSENPNSQIVSIEDVKQQSIGHTKVHSELPRTRIGVQKGSTLMKALSEKTSILSNTKSIHQKDDFSILKKERRDQIVAIIKDYSPTRPNLNGLTITDIKTKAQGTLASCGEKTLQRELVSMVKDNILDKSGSKRWSRYFIRNNPSLHSS